MTDNTHSTPPPEGPPEETSPSEDDPKLENDPQEEWFSEGGEPVGAEDAIDPALLALQDSGEPLPLHRPLIMAAVCVLIVAMMVWFRGELSYYFADSEPLDLGEAHEIDFRPENENRFVRLDGIPLAPRNQNPSARCGGQQGFPTYQRRFLCRGHQSAVPVMGRPDHDLIIQRFLRQQLRVYYRIPDDASPDLHDQAKRAARQIGAVHDVLPVPEGEKGRFDVAIQGRAGKTNLSAVAKSIKYRIGSSVPGVTGVRVESVRRDPPGVFEGRLVRLGDLGSRFGAVADYLNECTNYPVDNQTWVVLDGSEAGRGFWNLGGLCYGQAPRQYWPYLVLYLALIAVFFLNIWLLVRFARDLLHR